MQIDRAFLACRCGFIGKLASTPLCWVASDESLRIWFFIRKEAWLIRYCPCCGEQIQNPRLRAPQDIVVSMAELREAIVSSVGSIHDLERIFPPNIIDRARTWQSNSVRCMYIDNIEGEIGAMMQFDRDGAILDVTVGYGSINSGCIHDSSVVRWYRSLGDLLARVLLPGRVPLLSRVGQAPPDVAGESSE